MITFSLIVLIFFIFDKVCLFPTFFWSKIVKSKICKKFVFNKNPEFCLKFVLTIQFLNYDAQKIMRKVWTRFVLTFRLRLRRSKNKMRYIWKYCIILICGFKIENWRNILQIYNIILINFYRNWRFLWFMRALHPPT